MFKIHFTYFLLFFSVLIAPAQTWPAGAHDPSSMIKEGETYWVFATGDGIASKYSKDMVTWTDGPSPFPNGQFPSWILNYAKNSTDQFAGFFWAPDIIYMNNKYYLYYSCSVWGSMNSCIGCVTNKTLDPSSPDFAWVDQGDIGLFSPDFRTGGTGWDVNVIDPSMMRGPDNKVWMVYGSFNKGGIMVTQVDTITGKPVGTKTSIANSWTGGTAYGEGEGASMFYRNGLYYLVYNKGGCCNGIASSYYMVMGRSIKPTGPFTDKNLKPMRVIGAASGGTVLFRHDDSRGLSDRYFGPGHFGLYRENGMDYVSFHYYSPNGYYPSAEADYKGGPTLGLAFLKWGADGWPSLSFDFVEDGIYTLKNAHTSKQLDVRYHNPINSQYLWQYTADSLLASQKWIFKSIGGGEYSIRNLQDSAMYVEAAGVDLLRVNSIFSDDVNQKFRVVKDNQGRLMIYPTAQDKIFEIPNAFPIDYQVKLKANTNHACQRWFAQAYSPVTSLKAIKANHSDEIKLYPNPATESVSLHTEVVVSAIEIYSLSGRMIKTVDSNTNQFYVGDLSPGYYVLRANSVFVGFVKQ